MKALSYTADFGHPGRPSDSEPHPENTAFNRELCLNFQS